MGAIGVSSSLDVKKYRLGIFSLWVAILLPFGAASQPLASGVTEIVPFSTGSFVGNYKNMVAGGADRPISIPIPVFLIRHSKEGLILFDSGLGTEFRRQVEGWWVNRLLQLPLPYRLADEDPAVRQLEKIGIAPESIRMVVVSHLHLDHAGGLRDFPDATVVVSQREWDHANVGRLRARLRGYLTEQLVGIAPRVARVNYSPVNSFGPFEARYDLFGDGSLTLLSTPGHTPGHQSLLVSLADSRQALLTGDAVWVEEGFRRPAPKPWIIRTLEESDADRAWESTVVLHQFSKDHPEVLIVPGHDPDQWGRLPTLLR